MASDNHGAVLRSIDRVFNHGSATGLSEGQLLRQFATSGDEAAFEALVTRHGPMVLGVCRRLLYNPRDVEDAFQATFLVLLRRAGSLRDADPLSPWLHGVAYRVAARIRARSARQPAEERKVARPEAVESVCSLERIELQNGLDEEIGRFPEKYRRAVVLCYLEGQTHEQAARRLRCTEGVVRGRLDRARERLKTRLTRRGLAPSAGLIASSLAGDMASAAVPSSWIAGTVATLGRAAAAQAVSTMVSATALELADGVFRAMILAKLKFAASFIAAAAVILAVGAVLLTTLTHSAAHDGHEGNAPVAQEPRRKASLPETPQAGLARDAIDYRVVDKRTGRPMAGVTLIVQIDGKETGQKTTDEAGRATIPIPSPPPAGFMDVLARKEGFAPVRSYMRRPTVAEDIPASYTLAMVPVESVGGVVRDEQGRPVVGVAVEPRIWTRTSRRSANAMPVREEFDRPNPVRTDAQGRWRWEALPAGIEPDRVTFQFSHPDYQRVELPTDKGLEIIRRDGVTVLPRGLEITGRVVDPAGRPMPGARILRASTHFGGNLPHAEADADGRFQFSHVPAGEAILTVRAAGHAPDLKRVEVRSGLAPIEFRLEKGRTIQGRVVDRKGEPLAGARVRVEFWRKYQTLDWQIKTDDKGEFRWDHAPLDAVSIFVSSEGYLPIHGHEVPPAANAISITLVKQLKVRGTVVDAETRHAVKSFTLVPGMENGTGVPFSTYWNRQSSRTMSRGQYDIQFAEQMWQQGRRLRIEADGYRPEVSRVIHDDEDEPVVNFVLHKGAGVSGVVHLPDKSPLAGADVVLISPSQPAFINNGRPPDSVDHRVVKTGADGHFTFPAQEPPYTILVLHDRGFAEQTIGAKPSPAYDVTIQPWGRIEGTLRIGKQLGAGQTVSVSYDHQGDTPKTIPWWGGEARTDASGRFTFERVMPGAVHVARDISVKTSPSSTTTHRSPSMHVDVAPGATTRVTIGGSGRPIIGKLTAPAEIAGPVDWSQSNNAMIVKVTPVDMLAAAAKKLSGSRGPMARRSYSVVLDKDGSFRVEDVEADTYDLIFVVNEPSRDPRGFISSHKPLGSARRDVTVPAMPGGRSDEPLDLGTIPLVPIKKP